MRSPASRPKPTSPRMRACRHSRHRHRVQATVSEFGSLERVGKLDADLALGAHRFGAGQLGQALHARLGLLAPSLALALKRSMKALQVGALDLFLLERDLLLAQVLGTLALERWCNHRLYSFALPSCRCSMCVVTLSRNSRSCEITSSMPVALEQPLFQPDHRIEVEVIGRFIEQQHVRWASSARARRFRRTRQPPEKSATARFSWVSAPKPRPCSSLPARAVAS
jgi:hypothetical protein